MAKGQKICKKCSTINGCRALQCKACSTIFGVSKTEILGVEKTATTSEIRTAYIKLVKKLHPDKGGDVHRMQELNNAYEILKNASKRKKYDETGSTAKVNIKNEFINFVNTL